MSRFDRLALIRTSLSFVQQEVKTKLVSAGDRMPLPAVVHEGATPFSVCTSNLPFHSLPRHCFSTTVSTAMSEMPSPTANLMEQSFVV